MASFLSKKWKYFSESSVVILFFSKDGICNFEILKNIKQFPYGPLFKKIGIDIRDDEKF